MLRKSFIAITMIAFMVVSPILTSAEKTFTDLKKDNDHYEGIQWLVTKGITGYEDGTFGVERSLSRQHAAIMFSKVLDLDLPAKSKVEEYFNDVKRNHEYANYIGAVYEAGIFTGHQGDFLPRRELTREQMATTLVNAFDLKGTGKVKIRLDNVDPSHKKNVQILADLGITTELNDFRPRQAIKRGQFASFLYRVSLLDGENPVDPEPSEPNKKIVTTKYNYDFSTMVDAQMKVRPQTDSAGSWYHASRALLEYYANPNNFKPDSAAFYQFLLLSGSTTISDKDLNDKILANQGVLAGKAADFKEASKTYNVNEVYLIAHALLETGNGTSNLAKGVEVGQDKDGNAIMRTDENKASLKNIKTTYNFYGIGAVDRCPLKCGSERAYNEGWFTPKDAIIGGAKFINNGYIGAGQDTLYKMRWNPATPATHQYATDVGWAVKQTSRIEKVYDLYHNLGNVSMTFDVPAFNKQPAAKARPTGVAVFHVDTTHKHAGEKAYVTADALNFRTGPTTQFPAIRQLPKGTEITIIGENSGWYKIKAGNDEGWVSASYIQIGEPIKLSTYLVSMEEEVISEQDNELTTSGQTNRVIGEIIKDNVLVRETPSLSEITSVAELQAGTKVDILEEEANWYKVSFDDKEGWISSETIRFINILQVATGESTIQVKIDPNENSSTIGELFENETVIVVPDENKELTIDGEWYQIYYEGHTGWVHKDLLNIE